MNLACNRTDVLIEIIVQFDLNTALCLVFVRKWLTGLYNFNFVQFCRIKRHI